MSGSSALMRLPWNDYAWVENAKLVKKLSHFVAEYYSKEFSDTFSELIAYYSRRIRMLKQVEVIPVA